jgi:hypothetical protein
MSIVTLNDRGVRSVTTFGSATGLGNMVFIKKLTASSSSDLTFHDGTSSVVFDSTYKEYLFTFNNIHPATDGANFTFQGNAAGGSGFNETITSSYFRAVHNEADSASGLAYDGDFDQAQGTAFQMLSPNIGTDNDQSVSGQLTIFNPSSTTFVKHFISNSNIYQASDYCTTPYVAGYFNTTSAIDEIQFKMSSGNIDAGDICLYGIL